jgi:hypothetical protein
MKQDENLVEFQYSVEANADFSLMMDELMRKVFFVFLMNHLHIDMIHLKYQKKSNSHESILSSF